MNGLVCNPTKIDIVRLSSRFTLAPVPAAQDLGVTLDSHLIITSHINNMCKSVGFFAIRNIGRIRKYLSQAHCEKLIHPFVTSRLYSCNSILYDFHADTENNKLQRLQNSACCQASSRGQTCNVTYAR